MGGGEGAGEGVPLQRKQDGGETLLGTTDSSIGQLHRTTFCALKHARRSHDPAIYLDNGLSFDASLKVRRGEDVALAVGGGKAMRGKSIGNIG